MAISIILDVGGPYENCQKGNGSLNPIVVRKVWLQCFGVPLHRWRVEIFEAIGRKFGEVVEIAKETLDSFVLEVGRICIKTEDFSFINKELNINIFDRLFKVVVREELGMQARLKNKGVDRRRWKKSTLAISNGEINDDKLQKDNEGFVHTSHSDEDIFVAAEEEAN
ncbi:hypothetical protein AAC387_Pa02g2565 [Persea americana]